MNKYIKDELTYLCIRYVYTGTLTSYFHLILTEEQKNGCNPDMECYHNIFCTGNINQISTVCDYTHTIITTKFYLFI